MERLDPKDYRRLRPLFARMRAHLVVDSMIEGNTPAWAFVDDPRAPRVGLMWDRQDGLLLAGDPDAADDRRMSALRWMLGEEILPDARSRWIPALTLLVDRSEWSARFADLLPGREVRSIWRRAYRFLGNAPDLVAVLPSGYVLRRMNAALLEDDRLANAEEARGWVLSFWHSLADFERGGFGYGAVTSQAIASWCLTVFAAGDAYELGLATAPEHRGRGLATAVAAACISECLSRGATPRWQCEEANPASMAVAEKVGFGRPVRYIAYQFATA
jgi:RimJ/RimL family protein N-acetyltransferase